MHEQLVMVALPGIEPGFEDLEFSDPALQAFENRRLLTSNELKSMPLPLANRLAGLVSRCARFGPICGNLCSLLRQNCHNFLGGHFEVRRSWIGTLGSSSEP